MDKQSADSNGNKQNETRPERKHLTDLDQIVHRHLSDQNDKITEEDIRDAVIGFPGSAPAPVDLPADSKQFLQDDESA